MNFKVITAFSTGLILGVTLAWLLVSWRERSEHYVLTRDMDLEQNYFFSPKTDAPVRGVLKAGSQFEVEWRYSIADYIVFRTVVDREQLLRMSRPIAKDRTRLPSASHAPAARFRAH